MKKIKLPIASRPFAPKDPPTKLCASPMPEKGEDVAPKRVTYVFLSLERSSSEDSSHLSYAESTAKSSTDIRGSVI